MRVKLNGILVCDNRRVKLDDILVCDNRRVKLDDILVKVEKTATETKLCFLCTNNNL